LELDREKAFPWKGNYSSWLEQKENRLSQEEKTESERQKTLQTGARMDPDVPKADTRNRKPESPPMKPP